MPSLKKKPSNPKKLGSGPTKIKSSPVKPASSSKKPASSSNKPMSATKKPVSAAKKPGNVDDKVILNKILDIKVPEKYYSKPNLALRDILTPGDNNLAKGVAKQVLKILPSVLISDPRYNILINILAFLLSDAIPYEPVKVFIIDKIVKILNENKGGINFSFTKAFLKLRTGNSVSLKALRNLSFLAVLAIMTGAYVAYKKTGDEKGIFKYVNQLVNQVRSKTSSPFTTETTELTGETRNYLVEQKIIKAGDTTVRLEKLNILSPEISNLNPKGINIVFNPVANTKNPLTLKLSATVPYLDNSTKFLSGEVKINRTTRDLKDIQEELSNVLLFYKENLSQISQLYAKVLENISLVVRYDTIQRAHSYTIEDLIQEGGNNSASKIRIYENSGEEILKEGLSVKKLAERYSLPELAISNFLEMKKITDTLAYSGINIKAHSDVILKASLSSTFLTALRDNINIIRNTQSKLDQASRDAKSSTLKNINIVSLRIEDTASVLSNAIQRIKVYDRDNVEKFFSETNNLNTIKIS